MFVLIGLAEKEFLYTLNFRETAKALNAEEEQVAEEYSHKWSGIELRRAMNHEKETTHRVQSAHLLEEIKKEARLSQIILLL